MNGEQSSGWSITNTWESRPLKQVSCVQVEFLDYQKFGAFSAMISKTCLLNKGFVKTNAGDFEVSCVNEFAVMNYWKKNLTKQKSPLFSVGIKIISEVLAAWKSF